MGRKELRLILSWWKALHEEMVKKPEDEKKEGDDKEEKDHEEVDEDQDEFDQVDKQISELQVYNL